MTGSLDFLNEATWLNPPPEWHHDRDGLFITTGERTDFWRETFYGFERDTGHVLASPVDGNFTAVATFDGAYETLYDQAGLMLRIDERFWLKAGIEFVDGTTAFSTVVTRIRSDWSFVSVPLVAGSKSIRLTRIGAAVSLHFMSADGTWQLMRVADFPAGKATLGAMACSPKRAGFQVRFTAFTVGPPVESPLHSDATGP